jgi:hypothetical protein
MKLSTHLDSQRFMTFHACRCDSSSASCRCNSTTWDSCVATGNQGLAVPLSGELNWWQNRRINWTDPENQWTSLLKDSFTWWWYTTHDKRWIEYMPWNAETHWQHLFDPSAFAERRVNLMAARRRTLRCVSAMVAAYRIKQRTKHVHTVTDQPNQPTNQKKTSHNTPQRSKMSWLNMYVLSLQYVQGTTLYFSRTGASCS